MVDAPPDVRFRIAGTEQAALSVVAHQCLYRPADLDQLCGKAKNLHVATVPRDQAQIRIYDAYALRKVFEGCTQQAAVELDLVNQGRQCLDRGIDVALEVGERAL